VEPDWYAPILPMLLVNGSRGIGTGYSTSIPSYNPRQLRSMLTAWLSGIKDALDETLTPYFQGFKGKVAADGTTVGVYTAEKDGFRITELPPGTWTQDYREWLEKELAEGRIKDFTDVSTDVQINILVKGIEEPALIKSLTEKVKITNMHAFNSTGQITKYDSPNAILKEYAEVRLRLYETRRVAQIKALEGELPYHENVMRFIDDQCLDTPHVVLKKKTRQECDVILTSAAYTQIEGGFDYLMRLPVSSFTAEQSAKHRTKLESLRKEITTLKATKPADLWLTELSVL
jgi:DNA topoisomerase-2